MHIAEKYSSLARDAMASGDMVGAENYLQHAEHYNRIIMAAQAQNPNVPGMEGQGGGMNGGGRYNPSEPFQREFDGAGDDEDGDDFIPQPQKQYHERHDRGPRERSQNYNQHQLTKTYLPQQAYRFRKRSSLRSSLYRLRNGDADEAGDQSQPITAEGDRAPRRRRRRPMGEGSPKGFNGRNGGFKRVSGSLERGRS